MITSSNLSQIQEADKAFSFIEELMLSVQDSKKAIQRELLNILELKATMFLLSGGGVSGSFPSKAKLK